MALQTDAILTQSLIVRLLEPVLVHTSLLLKQTFPLRRNALLLQNSPIVFSKPQLVTPLLLELLLLIRT